MSEEYPKVRDLDGVYNRVIRNGQGRSLCFTDLTREEQEQFLMKLNRTGMKRMCLHMAETLRNIGDQLDLVFKDE